MARLADRVVAAAWAAFLAGCGSRGCGSGNAPATAADAGDGAERALVTAVEAGVPPPDEGLSVASLAVLGRFGIDVPGDASATFTEAPREVVIVEGQPLLLGCREGHWLAADGSLGARVTFALERPRDCLRVFAVEGGQLLGDGRFGLYAIDAHTGAQLWSYPVPDAASHGPPDLDDPGGGVSSATLRDGIISYRVRHRTEAIDLASRTKLWTFPAAASSVRNASSLFVTADPEPTDAAAGTTRRQLVAIDRRTGARRWSRDDPSTPLAASDRYLVVADLRAATPSRLPFHVVDPTTGETHANGVVDRSMALSEPSRLVLQHDELYALDEDALTRIDPETAQVMWRRAGTFPRMWTHLQRGRDALFVNESGGLAQARLMALDPANGEPLWSHDGAGSTTFQVVESALGELVTTFAGRRDQAGELTVFHRTARRAP